MSCSATYPIKIFLNKSSSINKKKSLLILKIISSEDVSVKPFISLLLTEISILISIINILSEFSFDKSYLCFNKLYFF